jgi:hypothetical protein
MRPSLHRSRLMCIAALMLTAAACSDGAAPASNEPASLTPGLYEISVSQSLKQFSDKETAPKPICVRSYDIDAFPHKLAEEYFVAQRGCRTVRTPREGNTVSGEVICPTDQKIAAGTTRFVYRGEIRPDHLSLEGNMVIDVDLPKGAGGPEISDAQLEKAMRRIEDIKTVIESRRLSDCS